MKDQVLMTGFLVFSVWRMVFILFSGLLDHNNWYIVVSGYSLMIFRSYDCDVSLVSYLVISILALVLLISWDLFYPWSCWSFFFTSSFVVSYSSLGALSVVYYESWGYCLLSSYSTTAISGTTSTPEILSVLSSMGFPFQ